MGIGKSHCWRPRGRKSFYVVSQTFHEVRKCFMWFPSLSTMSKTVLLGFQKCPRSRKLLYLVSSFCTGSKIVLVGFQNVPPRRKLFHLVSRRSETVLLGLHEVGNWSTCFPRGRKLFYLAFTRSETVLLGVHDIGNCFAWSPRDRKLFYLVFTGLAIVLLGIHDVGNVLLGFRPVPIPIMRTSQRKSETHGGRGLASFLRRCKQHSELRFGTSFGWATPANSPGCPNS